MPEPDWEIVAAIDADNLAWLKEVVAEVGWPGESMVGEDGAHAAWLLAQHADQDPAFQRRCLELLTQAVASGDAAAAALAYLTDRVLLVEGKAQEYGTQFVGRESGWTPRRLRDPETVDERRATCRLERWPRTSPEWRPSTARRRPSPSSVLSAGTVARRGRWRMARHLRSAALHARRRQSWHRMPQQNRTLSLVRSLSLRIRRTTMGVREVGVCVGCGSIRTEPFI